MKSAQQDFFQSITNERGFDCNKMRSLIDDKNKASFTERFRNWIAEYTTHSQEKVWRDVEYYPAD